MSESKKRVLLGMSGGVDSSMAVYLLQKENYDVKGVTLSLTCHLQEIFGESIQPREQWNKARKVADFFGIPHEIADRSPIFDTTVIIPFVNEYFNGRTPNPCVECNPKIKWTELLKIADRDGYDYVATGHYARVRHNEQTGRYELLKGKDPNKDQSYYLWQLRQDQLARTRFPLGEKTKERIKAIAADLGLASAESGESQDICFIPQDDYREFLKKTNPDRYHTIKQGNFITTDGNIAGHHPGYFHFTIGQRRGLRIAMGYPVYVVDIRPETNEVVIGKKEELVRSETRVSRVNWVSIAAPENPVNAIIKIRYRHRGLNGLLIPLSDNELLIKFNDVSEAVTPGQSAVFYDGDRVLGGGIIERT